jgi:GT2 family glycosyltransferase
VIAVAISTRNRPEALARCLASLGSSDLLPSEIVVVDQGDDPAPIDTSAAPVPIVHAREPGEGLAIAQNEAVRRASAAFVAVTDDDCVVDPAWLGALAAAFRDDPSLDLVAGRVLPLGEDEPGAAVSLRVGTQRLDFHGKAMPWLVGSGNNFAVRRERFLAVGGCDTRLGPGAPARGAMDMDLFYRLLRAGSRARYEPSAVVYHERKSAAARRRRRFDYGYGMGALCSLCLRAGDAFALRMLARWVALRLSLLRGGRPRRGRVVEELVVLGATARGLLFALRHERRSGA